MPNDLRAAAAALTIFCLSGCGGATLPARVDTNFTPSPRPTFAPPPPAGLQTPPPGTAYLGAYAVSEPGLGNLESAIGRKLAMSMHYYNWTDNFPGVPEDTDLAYGRYPIQSWNCGVSDATIAAGNADLLLTTRAQAIKGFGHVVFLRYMWEMNTPSTSFNRGACYDPNTDNPDKTFSATQFVAAWARARQIFAQAGATNAVWVWSVAASGSDPAPYYPGDALVDWVGVDVYDTTGKGFVPMMNAIYPKISQYNKPILIAETGETKNLQPQFFQAVVPALGSQFPLVMGMLYYDAAIGGTDWSLGQAGTAAFKTMSHNAFFAPMGHP